MSIRGLLHRLSRPIRRSGTADRAIHPYRGYGSPDRVYLMGRVFRQPGGGTIAPRGQLGADLLALGRRIVRWGLGGTSVRAAFAGAETVVQTDDHGYFEIELTPSSAPSGDSLWHPMALELTDHPEIQATGQVLIAPRTARHVVISDIDDTLVHTGVASMLTMLRNLFLTGASSRIAFPGARALYQGLHGEGENPMLYVSRGPWSIYEVLEAFFQRNEIPVGPVLFLRDWGLTLQHPLPRRARHHKHRLIERMLRIYDELPFVLIGDSGQHDPEIYAEVVARHPGRVAAVYIRNIEATATRREEIEELATQTHRAGCSLVLAADSLAIAEHAAGAGLVDHSCLPRVREEMAAAGETHKPTRHASEQSVGPVVADLDEDEPVNVEVDRER